MTFFPGFSAELIETSGTTIHVLREGVGPPVAIVTMLDFASPHNITPQNEHFPMSNINEAFARLESGKAHYRIVLDSDF